MIELTDIAPSGMLIPLAVVAVVILGAGLLLIRMYRRVPMGRALAASSRHGTAVTFSSGFVSPFRDVHLLDLSQHAVPVAVSDTNAARSSDGLRYELSALAYARLGHSEAHVTRAARHLGVEQLDDTTAVAELLQPFLLNAIKQGLDGFTFDELTVGYADARRAVMNALRQSTGDDVTADTERYGFIIEDIVLGNAKLIDTTFPADPERHVANDRRTDSTSTETVRVDVTRREDGPVGLLPNGRLDDLLDVTLHLGPESVPVADYYLDLPDDPQPLTTDIPGVADIENLADIENHIDIENPNDTDNHTDNHTDTDFDDAVSADDDSVDDEAVATDDDPYHWRSLDYQDNANGNRAEADDEERIWDLAVNARSWSLLLAAAGPLLGLAVLHLRHRHNFNGYESLLAMMVLGPSLAVAVTAGLGHLTGKYRTAGAVTAVAGFVFWNWTFTTPLSFGGPILWVAASIALGAVIALAMNSAPVTTPFVATITAVAALAVMTGSLWSVADLQVETESVVAPAMALAFASEDLPDVYLINVAGLTRPDVAEVLHDDGRSHHRRLTERLAGLGVEVRDRATANYGSYELSMASLMNVAIETRPGEVMTDADRYRAVQGLDGNNPLVSWFKRHGYQYWHAPSSLRPLTDCAAAVVDRCLSRRHVLRPHPQMMGDTPLGALLGPDARMVTDKLLTGADVTQWALPPNGKRYRQPRLIVAHVDAAGRSDAACGGGTDNMEIDQNWSSSSRPDYLRQVGCMLDDLTDTVEAIVSADPRALVVVSSATGPSFDLDLSAPASHWTTEDVWQRFAVLRVHNLPDGCEPTAASGDALVNTLPLLQGCIAEAAPTLSASQLLVSAVGATTTQVTNAVQGILPPACPRSGVEATADCVTITG